MSAIRKYLQILCGLMAVAWLLSVAIGIAQGCQLAILEETVLEAHTHVEKASSAHDDGDHADGNQHDASCLKHCKTVATGALKSFPQGEASSTALLLVCFVLLLLTAWSASVQARPTRRFSFAALHEPPTTIRFHRFNN